MKNLYKIINVLLWIVFAGCVVLHFMSPPRIVSRYEIADKENSITYQFTDDNGTTVESCYYPSWYYSDESKEPLVVVYDPVHERYATLKDEYIDQYKETMASPKHSTWLMKILFFLYGEFSLYIFIALYGALVYFAGGMLRDTLVYVYVRIRNDFVEYSTYINKKQFFPKNLARKRISHTIDKYIDDNKARIFRKYNESFATLIINLLNRIKLQNDTKIDFYFSYINNITNHQQYLSNLLKYWESKIGSDSNAEQNVHAVRSLMREKYVDVKVNVSASECVPSVTKALNEIFQDVIGADVISFNAISNTSIENKKPTNVIFLKTDVSNSHRNFTWSGQSYSGQCFFGLSIIFSIYHYNRQGERVVLWSRYLDPICTYKAEESSFSLHSLYQQMISETIASFPDALKK